MSPVGGGVVSCLLAGTFNTHKVAVKVINVNDHSKREATLLQSSHCEHVVK